MKSVIVVGASGATGRLLVNDLLERGVAVTAVVRPGSGLEGGFETHPNYQQLTADISEIADSDLRPSLEHCDAVLSCLGHNLTFGGVFGKPRRLVTDAIKTCCRVIETINPDRKVRVILMNTTGNSNRDIPEVAPMSQRFVIALLRVLLPPHADNEDAADFLRTRIGQDHPCIEWAAVRPDGLSDDSEVTDYEVHPSPIRNAIFDAGTTSRINVANFMANLATDSELWETWKGKMPVIYNAE